MWHCKHRACGCTPGLSQHPWDLPWLAAPGESSQQSGQRSRMKKGNKKPMPQGAAPQQDAAQFGSTHGVCLCTHWCPPGCAMPGLRGCSVLPGRWKPVPDHADSGESASVGRKNQFGVWGEQPGGQTSLPAAVVPMRSSTATPTVPHPITHNVPRSRLSCGIWHLPRAPSKVIPDPHPSPAVTQRGDPGESGAPTPLRNSPRPALGLLMTVMCREEGKSQRQGVG